MTDAGAVRAELERALLRRRERLAALGAASAQVESRRVAVLTGEPAEH